MADVFLSYARPNAAAAAHVARQLEKSGWSVWYDPDLPAHRAYSDVIAAELEAAKAVLVLWSAAAADSQWVRSEANRARELGKLVQARLDTVRLPMPFDQIQCADLTHWRRRQTNGGWPQVERSIGALVSLDHANARPPQRGERRREVLIGAGAAGTAALLGGGWWLLVPKRSGVSAETAALIAQAKGALWQNTPEGQNQAIGIYRQVAADNPTLAEAWGRLAMAYAVTSHWRGSTEAATLHERARSAGQRALSLNAHDVHALTGIALAKPFMGNWLDMIRRLRRALTFEHKDAEANLLLALVLSMTGQNREALQHVDSILPAVRTPGIYVWNAQMLWSAGRQDELDALLDEARKLYPTHFGVWFTRFYTLMMGGRPEAALALAADTANWPTGIEPNEIELVTLVAKAVQSARKPEVDAVVDQWMERAHHGAGYAENAAQFMATLGRPDDAFAVLDAYYFSRGFDCGEVRFERAMGSFTAHNDRQTGFLFNPAIAPLRRDARFSKLMDDLRLSGYWRASGRNPDPPA